MAEAERSRTTMAKRRSGKGVTFYGEKGIEDTQRGNWERELEGKCPGLAI